MLDFTSRTTSPTRPATTSRDKDDKESAKAGADAEFDLKSMQARLKAYYADPTVKAALEVTAAADKIAARLELTAVKSGVVVTADFEKSLKETKVAIEVMRSEGKTQLAAELKVKADELSGKIALVHKTKDLKLAAELEAIRSIDDATALNAKLQEVMAPIKASASKAKTLRGKSAIAASFGFSIAGDWPGGGKAAPPAGMFAVKIAF